MKRELSVSLGILDPSAGVSQRATYIVDPNGIIRFVYVTDLSVGRSPKRGVKEFWMPCKTGAFAPVDGKRETKHYKKKSLKWITQRTPP